MRITPKARSWFKAKYGAIQKPFYSSKLYKPEESWTKDYVWFVQVPIATIKEHSNGFIHIACQKLPESNDFYYLKTPASFFLKHLDKFDTIKNNLALYFLPEKKNHFKEIRGKGKISFEQFLVN